VRLVKSDPRVDFREVVSLSTQPTWLEQLGLWYLPFLAGVALTFSVTPDDALITLRYAANFVHGHGLVYNSGQHVQGFTSYLGLFVAIIVYLSPGALVLLKMKIASLIFGLLAIHEAGQLLYGLEIPRWSMRTGIFTAATCAIVAFASGNGLETSLEMWLLIAVARRLVVPRSLESSFVIGAFAVAAVLARPDALAPLTVMAVCGLLLELSQPLARRVAWFAGAIGAGVVTVIFNVFYFNSLLPNTYYAKSLPVSEALTLGYQYIQHLLQPEASTQFNLVFILQVLFFSVGAFSSFRHHRRSIYLLALIVGQTLFVLKSGGDWMIGKRFLAAAAIPFIVIEVLRITLVASSIGRRLKQSVKRTPQMMVGMLLVFTSLAPFSVARAPAWSLSGLDDRSLIASGAPSAFSVLSAGVPSTLKCLKPGQLVATSEIGYLGFARLDLRILDVRGLTNRAIAMSAPSSLKTTVGVDDTNWYEASSPVGKVLLAEKPAVIAELDSLPQSYVLGGRYRLVKETVKRGVTLGFYVPRNSRGICQST